MVLQGSDPIIRVGSDLVEGLLQEELESREAEGFLYGTPWLHGGALLARMDAKTVNALKGRLGSLERELLRPVKLKIELLAFELFCGGRRHSFGGSLTLCALVSAVLVSIGGGHPLRTSADNRCAVLLNAA